MPDAAEVALAVDLLRGGSGEHAELEVKAAVSGLPKSLRPTLSAFANGRGGLVLLGLSEEHGFAPAPGFDASRTAVLLDETASTEMTPPLRLEVDVVDVDGHQVVAAWVPELPAAQKPCWDTASGEHAGSYLRSFEGDRRLTAYEVTALRENRGQPRYDVEPTEASRGDLDDAAVAALLARVRDRQPRAFTVPDDVALQRLGVLVRRDGVLVPSLGGLLTLCSYPQQFFPQLHISFVHVPGQHKGVVAAGGPRFLDNRTIVGSLPVMVEEAVAAVTRNMALRSTVTGVGRSDAYDYPVDAVREAVVNAVMHRDYGPQSRGAQVQVEMYSDRLDVVSPGGLFGPVIPEQLGEVTSSRNSQLSLLLSDVALPDTDRVVCENRASGIPTMTALLRRAGLSVPEFDISLARFRLSFPRSSLVDAETVQWIVDTVGPDVPEAQRLALALVRRRGQVDSATLQQAGLGAAEVTVTLRALTSAGVLQRSHGRRYARYRLSQEASRAQPSLFDLPSPPMRPALPEGADRRAALLRQLDDGGEHHVLELAEALGLGRAMVTRYLNELILSGDVEATAPPRARQRRYRRTGASSSASRSSVDGQ